MVWSRTPRGTGSASSGKAGEVLLVSSVAARPRSMSPRVRATRRLWASTTSSRFDWARRGGEGTRRRDGSGSSGVGVVDEDDEGEEEDEEEEAWKVAPLRRDMALLTV